ncbi:MAG: response regulator, partial [Anaerolineales bacterium]
MPDSEEYLLLVIPDKKTANYLAHQVLARLGYRIEITHDASTVLEVVSQNPPDLIIADLHARGLSCKDLMVALKAQNIEIPFIILSSEVDEGEILQAFRLGATDFILTPTKDAEIISVVDRALQQVFFKKQRRSLQNQLNQLQEEVNLSRNLTATLMTLGKAMASITNQERMFKKFLSCAIQVTDADMGWLLEHDENIHKLELKACQNTPDALARLIGRPLDDNLSASVRDSGKALHINGPALQGHPIYHPGKAALIAPIKNKTEVLGIITVIRKQDKPFDINSKKLLEVIADFSSLFLVNAHLLTPSNKNKLNLKPI